MRSPVGCACRHACARRRLMVVRTSANGVLDAAWGIGGSSAIPLGWQRRLCPHRGRPRLLASASGELYVGFDERITGTWQGQGCRRAHPAVRSSGRWPSAPAGMAGYRRDSAATARISAMASDGKGHLILGLTYSDLQDASSHLLLRVSASHRRGLDRLRSRGARWLVPGLRHSDDSAVGANAPGGPRAGRHALAGNVLLR